jgi:hypothetical protein
MRIIEHYCKTEKVVPQFSCHAQYFVSNMLVQVARAMRVFRIFGSVEVRYVPEAIVSTAMSVATYAGIEDIITGFSQPIFTIWRSNSYFCQCKSPQKATMLNKWICFGMTHFFKANMW